MNLHLSRRTIVILLHGQLMPRILLHGQLILRILLSGQTRETKRRDPTVVAKALCVSYLSTAQRHLLRDSRPFRTLRAFPLRSNHLCNRRKALPIRASRVFQLRNSHLFNQTASIQQPFLKDSFMIFLSQKLIRNLESTTP